MPRKYRGERNERCVFEVRSGFAGLGWMCGCFHQVSPENGGKDSRNGMQEIKPRRRVQKNVGMERTTGPKNGIVDLMCTKDLLTRSRRFKLCKPADRMDLAESFSYRAAIFYEKMAWTFI